MSEETLYNFSFESTAQKIDGTVMAVDADAAATKVFDTYKDELGEGEWVVSINDGVRKITGTTKQS